MEKLNVKNHYKVCDGAIMLLKIYT